MATPAYTTVELMTLAGPEYRRVSTAPTRPARADEIPVIDLDGMWFYGGGATMDSSRREKDAAAAKARIAAAIRAAATGPGFFYVAHHGIPEAVIAAALDQARRFFAQPHADKMRASAAAHPLGNGYAPVNSSQINRSESRDRKEGFNFRYVAENDPLHAGEARPAGASASASGWATEPTQHLPGFQAATLAWWQHCLQLARGLVRLFALALDLPEDYFDAVTTHPGADGLYICYPGGEEPEPAEKTGRSVGIGSHTDMQCFTLLWQDDSGGLEVLLPTAADDDDDDEQDPPYEWVGATPRPGTLVVNIADFLQRLSNDRFRSTVHRVYNQQPAPRFSMPFFFGFNYDAQCAVVPTCVDAAHPPRYAPISCGQRMALAGAATAAAAEPGTRTD